MISPKPTWFYVRPVPVALVDLIRISTAAESASLRTVTMSDSPPRCSSRGQSHVEPFERSNAVPLKRPCLQRLHEIFPTKSYSKDILAALFSVFSPVELEVYVLCW